VVNGELDSEFYILYSMSSLRDFNTISPSAGALLMMKAMTDIPFARDTAAMVGDLETYRKSVREKRSKMFLGRMIHFENRYKTIDLALEAIQPTQVIELSSGFSCRGLAMALKAPVTYIDTDLPEFISNKKILVDRLITEQQLTLQGALYVEPLNALDELRLLDLTKLLPAGAVTMVNEGLLMYLDMEEKRRLCSIIRSILKERGGQWITGDVYIKRDMTALLQQQHEQFDEELTKFLEEHNIEANKFDSYNAAEAFFTECGFSITRKIDAVYNSLSSLQYIPYSVEEDTVKEWMKGRETWVLEPL
jgi:O-methyltransferase involved in polyketide biosynthesis